MLFALLLAAVQIASVVQARLMVAHGARELGRTLIVDPTADPFTTALAAADFDATRLDVTATGARTSGQLVTVRVSYQTELRIPLIGTVARPVVRSEVTVQLE